MAKNTTQSFSTHCSERFQNLRIYFWPVVIFLFALLVRLFYWMQLKNFPLSQVPVVDGLFYIKWAESISLGDWLTKWQGIYYLNPGYPYLLSFIFLIFGRQMHSILLIQFIIGTFSCVFVYLLAKEYFNHRVGIISSIVALLYGVSLFLEGLPVTASWINFWNLLMLLTITIALKRNSLLLSFFAGIFLGLSNLFRAGPVILIPGIILYMFISGKKKREIAYISSSLILGFLLFFLPVILRNSLFSKQLILSPTAHSGINFYIGNHLHATGSYVQTEFDTGDPKLQIQDYRKRASQILGREVSLNESSNFWFSEGMKFIKGNPLKWLALVGRKFYLLLGYYETGLNYSYYFFQEQISFLKLPFLLSYGFIVPFALIGLVLSIERKNLLLHFFIICAVVVLLLFYVTTEYRYSIVPIFIIFHSYFLYWMYEQIKTKRYKVLCLSLMASLGWALFINFPRKEIKFDRDYVKLATAHLTLGEADQGIALLERALEYKKESYIYYNLAHAYAYEKHDYVRAIENYKKAIESDLNNLNAYEELVEVYLKTKEYENAEKTCEGLIKIYPKHYPIHQILGNIYYLRGKKKQAIQSWENSLRIYPNNPELRKNIERLLEKKG